MSKITEYTRVNNYDQGDVILIDGTNGTRTLPVEKAGLQLDNTLTQTGKAADAKKTGDELGSLKSEIDYLAPSVLITNLESHYSSTENNYYRIVDNALSINQTYVIKFVCSTSAAHTFQLGTAGSAGSMVDSLGPFDMVANKPLYVFGYTPSGSNFTHIRNVLNDEWDVGGYASCNQFEEEDPEVNEINRIRKEN